VHISKQVEGALGGTEFADVAFDIEFGHDDVDERDVPADNNNEWEDSIRRKQSSIVKSQ
jgi:hypothetical protein